MDAPHWKEFVAAWDARAESPHAAPMPAAAVPPIPAPGALL
jgi:hypothetical protein